MLRTILLYSDYSYYSQLEIRNLIFGEEAYCRHIPRGKMWEMLGE